MSSRARLALACLMVFVGCTWSQNPRPTTTTPDPVPRVVVRAQEDRSLPAMDPVVALALAQGRPCRLQPPAHPAGAVLEVRIRTNHVVYRVAVMNEERRRSYPPPNACYIAGVEGEEVSVYFEVGDPRSVAITSLTPSELPGQAHLNPGGVILPRRITLAGIPLTTRVECWDILDITACEHAIVN